MGKGSGVQCKMSMLLQELTNEQTYLQNLWNKHGAGGQIAYVSRVGWWVVIPNREQHNAELLFLGRAVQDAQDCIKVNAL